MTPASHLRAAMFALAAAAAACSPVERPPAPLDAFTFPTGLALAQGRLIVVSSNSDLTYQDDKGGSVLSVDPEAFLNGTRDFQGLRTPSFGGELAVADAAACGLPKTLALSPNRLSGKLLRLELDGSGRIACAADCEVPIADPGKADPFAVEVACRPGMEPRARAFVGWLRPRTGAECGVGAASTTTCATVSEIDLGAPGDSPVRSVVAANTGGIRKLVYDAKTDLLFFVTTGSQIGWVDLSTGCSIGADEGGCRVQAFDLAPYLRGAEVRSIALSSPGLPLRLYVSARLFDPSAASQGVRVDAGSALVILTFERAALGGWRAVPLRVQALGGGASEVSTVARPGRADLVIVSVSDDGELWFWDDELGAVTGVIGRGKNGAPFTGRKPFAIVTADGPTPGLPLRVYVGAYEDGAVAVFDVDPAEPSGWVALPKIGG